MVIRRKSDKNKEPEECRYHEQFLHEANNQALHETRQWNDADHDRRSCWCCCASCMDLAWKHLPRKGVWWVRTPSGALRMMPESSPASPGSAETSPS